MEKIRSWDEIMADLERLTSPQGCWTIEAHDHRSCYQTVEDTWDDGLWDFESEEEARRSRQENRLIGLHWYKDSPVGSYKVAAPDMEGLRRAVSRLIDSVLE